MLDHRRRVVILARGNARIDCAVEVHIDPLAATKPLGDIRLMRSVARFQRKAVPHSGKQRHQYQRQRRPARQARQRPSGQGHGRPRAERISEDSAIGRKARPMNMAGATTAPQ